MYTVDIPVVFFHKDVPYFSRSVGCSSWKSESTRPRWMKLPVAIRPPSRRQVFSVWVMLESEGQNCGNPMKSIEIQTFFGTGHRALLAERNVHRKRVVPALWRSHILNTFDLINPKGQSKPWKTHDHAIMFHRSWMFRFVWAARNASWWRAVKKLGRCYLVFGREL